jgi:hypothetical protein
MIELNSDEGRVHKAFMWMGCGMRCGVLPNFCCGSEASEAPDLEQGRQRPVENIELGNVSKDNQGSIGAYGHSSRSSRKRQPKNQL